MEEWIRASKSEPDYKDFDVQAGKTWIYPTNYPIRDYQFNIIEQALYKNTLVSLPTGLGKTFIAAVIMYNFYRWYPQGKIIFMAPTRPLVKQQIEACYDIMAIPKEVTAELTGSKVQVNRQEIWMEKRVFFVTPQVLQNDLHIVRNLGSQIKCLVFDEAHKARGNYAYCEVIRLLNLNDNSFRVLALSATPGGNLNDILEVVNNLMISHLEFRTEESPDVKSYVFERNLETIVVPLGDKLEEVKNEYLKVLEAYTRTLTKYKLIHGNYGSLTKGKIFMTLREFQERNKNNRVPNYSEISKTLNICVTLYHAYELLIRHGLRGFLNFFQEHIEKPLLKGNMQIREIMESISEYLGSPPNIEPLPDGTYLECSKDTKFGHPKFYKLRDVLDSHFSEVGNESSKVIVFFEYRESVMEAFAMLLKARPRVRPKIFLGQGSGITQRIQINVIKSFRQGDCNTLLSTCIGEEGLDVGEVNLIVCFDISNKSPIRMVQRMGRTGRKSAGQIIILVTEGKEQQTLKDCLMQKHNVSNFVLTSKELSKGLYPHSPRMVPDEITPQCQKMHITVKKPALTKHSTLKEMFKSISSSSASLELSQDIEYVELKERIPESKLYCFQDTSSSKLGNEMPASLRHLEKQRILQPCGQIGHSSLSKILVDLLKFGDSKRFNIPSTQQTGTQECMELTKRLKQGDIRNMFSKPPSGNINMSQGAFVTPTPSSCGSSSATQPSQTETLQKFGSSNHQNELQSEISDFLSIQMSLERKCKICSNLFRCFNSTLVEPKIDLQDFVVPDISIVRAITLEDLQNYEKNLTNEKASSVPEINKTLLQDIDLVADDTFMDDSVFDDIKVTQIIKNEELGQGQAESMEKSFAFKAPATLDTLLRKFDNSIVETEEIAPPEKVPPKTVGVMAMEKHEVGSPEMYSGKKLELCSRQMHEVCSEKKREVCSEKKREVCSGQMHGVCSGQMRDISREILKTYPEEKREVRSVEKREISVDNRPIYSVEKSDASRAKQDIFNDLSNSPDLFDDKVIRSTSETVDFRRSLLSFFKLDLPTDVFQTAAEGEEVDLDETISYSPFFSPEKDDLVVKGSPILNRSSSMDLDSSPILVSQRVDRIKQLRSQRVSKRINFDESDKTSKPNLSRLRNQKCETETKGNSHDSFFSIFNELETNLHEEVVNRNLEANNLRKEEGSRGLDKSASQASNKSDLGQADDKSRSGFLQGNNKFKNFDNQVREAFDEQELENFEQSEDDQKSEVIKDGGLTKKLTQTSSKTVDLDISDLFDMSIFGISPRDRLRCASQSTATQNSSNVSAKSDSCKAAASSGKTTSSTSENLLARVKTRKTHKNESDAASKIEEHGDLSNWRNATTETNASGIEFSSSSEKLLVGQQGKQSGTYLKNEEYKDVFSSRKDGDDPEASENTEEFKDVAFVRRLIEGCRTAAKNDEYEDPSSSKTKVKQSDASANTEEFEDAVSLRTCVNESEKYKDVFSSGRKMEGSDATTDIGRVKNLVSLRSKSKQAEAEDKYVSKEFEDVASLRRQIKGNSSMVEEYKDAPSMERKIKQFDDSSNTDVVTLRKRVKESDEYKDASLSRRIAKEPDPFSDLEDLFSLRGEVRESDGVSKTGEDKVESFSRRPTEENNFDALKTEEYKDRSWSSSIKNVPEEAFFTSFDTLTQRRKTRIRLMSNRSGSQGANLSPDETFECAKAPYKFEVADRTKLLEKYSSENVFESQTKAGAKISSTGHNTAQKQIVANYLSDDVFESSSPVKRRNESILTSPVIPSSILLKKSRDTFESSSTVSPNDGNPVLQNKSRARNASDDAFENVFQPERNQTRTVPNFRSLTLVKKPLGRNASSDCVFRRSSEAQSNSIGTSPNLNFQKKSAASGSGPSSEAERSNLIRTSPRSVFQNNPLELYATSDQLEVKRNNSTRTSVVPDSRFHNKSAERCVDLDGAFGSSSERSDPVKTSPVIQNKQRRKYTSSKPERSLLSSTGQKKSLESCTSDAFENSPTAERSNPFRLPSDLQESLDISSRSTSTKGITSPLSKKLPKRLPQKLPSQLPDQPSLDRYSSENVFELPKRLPKKLSNQLLQKPSLDRYSSENVFESIPEVKKSGVSSVTRKNQLVGPLHDKLNLISDHRVPNAVEISSSGVPKTGIPQTSVLNANEAANSVIIDLTESDIELSPIIRPTVAPPKRSLSQLSITQMLDLIDGEDEVRIRKQREGKENVSKIVNDDLNLSLLDDLRNYGEFNESFTEVASTSKWTKTSQRRTLQTNTSQSQRVLTFKDANASRGPITLDDSDDEFQRPALPISVIKANKKRNVQEKNEAQNSDQDALEHRKKLKRKPTKSDFIEYEAELSDEDNVFVSEDEQSDEDEYDKSFVNDETQFNDTQVHAKYLQTTRSPVGQGRFKIPQKPRHNITNVFSQVVNDEDNTYLHDSFCVDIEDVECTQQNELSELEILEKKLKERRKKKRNKSSQSSSVPKRRRILQLSSDESD